MTNAQPHNGELYRQAWQQFLDQHPSSPQKVEGFALPAWTPTIPLDTASPITWQVLIPSVAYQPLADQAYQRTLNWHLTLKDSVLQNHNWTYTDTLTRKQLKRVLHQSPPDISGDDPTRHGKLWVPLAWIGGGTVLSVGLFVVRSVFRN